MQKEAVVIYHMDNVATSVRELPAQSTVSFFVGNEVRQVRTNQKIPLGHKFAIVDIEAAENILKYGESIGQATTSIKTGDHVHVHNMQSNRGRGDLR